MTGVQPQTTTDNSILPSNINDLYTQVTGNVLKPGQTVSDKASEKFNNLSPVKYIKEQTGNLAFIVMGIVVVAIALAWGNKETIIKIATEGLK